MSQGCWHWRPHGVSKSCMRARKVGGWCVRTASRLGLLLACLEWCGHSTLHVTARVCSKEFGLRVEANVILSLGIMLFPTRHCTSMRLNLWVNLSMTRCVCLAAVAAVGGWHRRPARTCCCWISKTLKPSVPNPTANLQLSVHISAPNYNCTTTHTATTNTAPARGTAAR